MDVFAAYLVAAGACLLASIALGVNCRNARQLLDEIWAVDTYSARELRRMCSGGFDATVEIEGEVSCDEPLTAPASGKPCCWFRTTVEREARRTRTVTETDSHGRHCTHTEVHYEWETTLDLTRNVIFKVRDATGCTLVDPEGADIDSEQVANRVVRGREPWFGSEVRRSDTGRYRIIEWVFEPSGYAFVIGRASCHGAEVVVRYPDRGYLDPAKKYFVISRKTEKELIRSKQTAAAVCFWFSIALLLAAGVCVFLAFRCGR